MRSFISSLVSFVFGCYFGSIFLTSLLRLSFPRLICCFVLLISTDRLVFHDQPVPGRHRDAIRGNEEAGNGENEVGAGQVPFNKYPRLIHKQLGAHFMLR